MAGFSKFKLTLIFLFLAYWIFTFCKTHDYVNWFIENLLVFIFVTFFIIQRQAFRQLSSFAFVCVFLFVMMHVSGSQYAYTHHPIGIWMKDFFHLQRNGFDRVVHFCFGLFITIPLKEFIEIKFTTRFATILAILWICTMAGVFEIIEWTIGGVLYPETGTDYVGTQGDVWDAQKDMALAMIASVFIIGLFHLFYLFKKSKS